MKFGKVETTEFQPTVYSVDSSADAVYLFDFGKTYFEGNTKSYFSIVQERHVRIRLLHRKAFSDIATIEIRLYTPEKDAANNEEKISDLEAATYNIKDEKIESTKLEKANIFRSKDGNFTTLKFTFPNIREGSIIEYHYKKTSPRFWDMDDWFFQGTYPRLWSEFTIVQPELFNFVVTGQNPYPYVIDTTRVYTQGYSVLIDKGTEASETVNIHSGVIEHTWAVQNIPTLKEEPYISSLSNYIASIGFQLYAIKMPEAPVKKYMNDWMQEAKDLMENENFGQGLDNTSFLTNDLQSIASSNNLEKRKNIFNYIRDNYTSSSKRGFYLSQPLKQTWKTKKGSIADINMLLVAAYRNQGFTAYPVLIGTRDGHRPSTSYPLMDRFNYVLCKLQLDNNEYVLLDATDKRLGFKHLNTECYNGYGRTINPAFPDLVCLSPDSIKNNEVTIVNIANKADGNGMEGSFFSQLGSFSSQTLRDKVAQSSLKDFFEKERKGYSYPINLTEYGIDSLMQVDMPVNVHYTFKLEKNDEDIIYFNPMMGKLMKENPFKAASRYYPVEMPYQMSESYIFVMETPKGYLLDDKPKSTRITLNEDEGLFSYIIQNMEDKVQIQCRLSLNKATFTPEDYNSLRDFFAYIVKKENEPIVFKKIH